MLKILSFMNYHARFWGTYLSPPTYICIFRLPFVCWTVLKYHYPLTWGWGVSKRYCMDIAHSMGSKTFQNMISILMNCPLVDETLTYLWWLRKIYDDSRTWTYEEIRLFYISSVYGVNFNSAIIVLFSIFIWICFV